MSDNENWVTDESFGYAAPSAPSEESDGNWFTDKAIDTAKGIANLGTTAIDLGALGLSAMANSRLRKNYEDQGLNPDDAPRVDINADLRNYGYSPTGMNQWFNSHYSKGRQAAEQEVEEAEGFTGKVKAYLTNPDVLVGRGFENLSNLAGLAGISRMAAKAALKEGTAMGLTGDALEKYIQRRATTASAVGEGGLSAAGVSQAIGEDNLENGKGYSENQHYALGAGAAVGLFSPLSNMEARMGAKGILNSIVKREAISTGEPVSLLKTIGGKVGSLGKDIIKEGAIEEGGQNVAEGIFTRLGQGKPWHEGIGEDYGEGLVIGGAMGAAMHSFAGKPKGSVEQAINNSSSQQAAEEVAARPKTELNPEEQSQIAQAAADAQNPNSQAQQPAEAQAQEPTMSPEEAELARMNAEDAARRQAVIDKYGLEFNREHGVAFADVTRNITDEAEKDFHAKILQAAGMMGIKNPFKEKEAAANFATEYKTFGGDLAKLAEFYRNIGIKAENDAGKKQGALRQAEFYQQLADLLEGGELLNFEQRRARKEEKKAAQAAEIQAAQVQQTAEQMKAQEPAPVEAQPEMKTQPKSEAQTEIDSTIPSEEELSTLEPNRKRNYRGKVAAIIARLESEGKISPEQKEQVYRALNNVRKGGSQLGAYKAAISKLRSIENPPPKKVKPESGLERAQKDAIKRTANSILTSAENLPASVGYTPEQRTAFKAQHAGLLSIQKSKFSASKKELEDWSEAHAVGDFEKATAIYDKYKARQMAKSYETLVKDLEEGVEGKAEFLEAVKRRDWQQAVNIAEDTMDLTPRGLIKSVKSKKAIVSETAADGEYELATEDSYENEPSHQLAQREADENDLTKVGGQVTTDAISIEPYKGEIAPDVRETAKMLYEDREGLDAALSREGDKQDQSVIPLYYALLEQAMQAKDNAMARKLASMIKRIQKKPTQLENEKPDEAPKLTKEEAKKEEAGTDLEVSNRRPTSRIPESNITQTNSINKTTADKEPVVVNATIPESPFEKKEEEPKKAKFGDALKKAFDEAKEKAKTDGESKPVEIKGSVPKPPKDPFKGTEENKTVVSAVEGKEKDAKAVAKAEMKVRSILESMQDYLGGKRKKRLSENQVDLVNELKDKGFLFVDDEKILDDYNKRIETKFGKSTRHASRSNRTLRSIEDHVRRGVPTSIEKAKGLIREFVNSESGKNFVNFLMVNDSVAKQVEREIGVDVQGFAFQLRKDDITHITDHHGNEEVEAARGQRAWKPEDYENLPEVLNSPDKVEIAEYQPKPEAPRVKFEKRLPNGDVLVVEEVLVGRGVLEIVTGYIKTNKAAESHDLTSETPSTPKADVDMPLSDRKRSVSLTPKQRKQNYNDVRNGLNKSWGVSTTKELLDSGKVVICDSNENFIDTIVKDYLAKDPSLSEDEVRNTLREEGLDKGTNAIYDENTGKVYINGENVDENEAGSVLAHEIGVHAAKDSEFRGLVKDIEDRVATLMAEGLKSKNPAVKKFWEDVKRRMDDADVSDNEERLAYFLEVYVKRNGVIPQSIQSEMYRAVGQLKDWLLKFLGIKSINEHKAAELLCDVVRAYADQSAMEKGGGRHASKKGKNDKPKKPRKQLTPEEKAEKEKEKLAKMTPSQRASYERRKKIADLKKEVQKQKDFREGEAYRDQKAQEEDMKDFNDLQGGKPIVEVVKSRSERASGMEKQAYAIGEKVLAYLKRAATYLNFRFLKFTNELVNDIGERCPAAKVWYNELLEWGKDRQKYRAEAQEIFSRFDKFPKNVKDEVESLLFDSTTSGQWAFDISDWKDAKGNNLTAEKYSINPELEARFDELAKNNPQAAMVVYDTLKHGYDRFIQIKTKIDTVGKAVFGDKYRSLIKMPKSVMPYVPLVRTGQYNVVWRSHQLKAEYLMLDKLKAERDAYEEKKQDIPSALTNAIKNTESKIDAMERNENHYVVSRFDSLAKAIDFQSELNGRQRDNQATLTDVGDQQKKSLTGQANIDRMLSDFEEKFEEHYGKGMGVAMRQAVQEMLLESAQKTLHSATKQRRNITGANPHVMETFMHHANTDAWMLSNLDHGKKISNAFTTLYKEVEAFRNSPKTEDQKEATELSDIYNELARRYNFITKREDHGLTDDVVEGVRAFNTFSMLSLKPAYYIQNALQPTMMTMPYLSGEFGVGQTMAQMKHSYGEWLGFVKKTWGTAETKREKYHAISNIMDAIQGSKLPEDIKEMLLDMERLNLLDLGAQADFGSFRGNNALLKMANKGMTELGYLARSVELANRYVTATAAYRMMKTKLLGQKATKEEAEAGAKEYAAKVLSKTQGDYSGINAPSAFNTKLGKVALQFRKFQAIQLNYFLDMAKGSFKGMTKDERGVYQKQLTVAIATHLVMAGMNGAPAMAIGYMLAGALFGDDGEDGEDTVRRLLSEAGWSGDMIDIAMEGPLSAIGINLSNSVGAGQMFSPVPYTRKGLTEEGGMMEFLTSAFGGATASRLIRLHTGAVQSKESNNWGRPFWEAALPAGIPQMLKAAHIIDPTVDKRTGAKMLKDEDFTVWHSFVQALGFTPSPVERMYQMRNVAYKTQKAIKEEKGDLTRRWIDAMKNRDYKAQSEIRKELPELNKTRRAKGFKPVSMNDLMTAWKTRQKEEKLMQKNHGLKLPNSQQGFAKQLNKIYN